MEAATFDEIAERVHERVVQMIWCNMTTVDARGRPRSRIVQPIWDGADIWVASLRNGLKSRHLARNAFVSLAYIGDNVHPLYVDASAAWIDESAMKQRIWELSRSLPDPLTYDLTPLYQSPDNPNFGLLKLSPWRVELGDMFGRRVVWHASSTAVSRE